MVTNHGYQLSPQALLNGSTNLIQATRGMHRSRGIHDPRAPEDAVPRRVFKILNRTLSNNSDTAVTASNFRPHHGSARSTHSGDGFEIGLLTKRLPVEILKASRQEERPPECPPLEDP